METDLADLRQVSHLSRIDPFLSVGLVRNPPLLNRRLLGIVQDAVLDVDLDTLLEENLRDLDFNTLKGDTVKLGNVVERFFRRDHVAITDTHPYFDRLAQADKPNVLIVSLSFNGDRRFVVLKYMEEGPRREALALRINNILTDSPIPFMQSGYTALQMGIRGIGLDESPDLEREEDQRAFNFSLGKAEEYGGLIALGDRKPEDLLQVGTRVSHVDFGAAFSVAESVGRFAYESHPESFAAGQEEGRRIIRERYRKHGEIVDVLLEGVDDEFIDIMNSEDRRKLFPVSLNPAVTVRSYLRGLEIAA